MYCCFIIVVVIVFNGRWGFVISFVFVFVFVVVLLLLLLYLSSYLIILDFQHLLLIVPGVALLVLVVNNCLMFGTGWWIIIGASANTEHGADLNGEYYLPGIFQVVSFLMINLISWEALDANNADQYSSPNVVVVNRAIFIFGIIIQLACLIFAVFIVVSDFADENSAWYVGSDGKSKW
mgnify:CR=1 FL=1